MQHDNPNEGSHAADSEDRDVLGDLIQAAGRRPVPSTDQYRETYAASHDAWQEKVRSTKRRQRVFSIAASFFAVAIVVSAVWQLAPVAPIPSIATAVVVQGDAAIFSPQTGSWDPLAEPGVEISPGARIRTADSGRTALRLGDLVSVRINSDSEIIFISATQLELVAGMVYLDSGSSFPIGGLEVTTPHGIVRDIGTQFELRSLTDGLRVRVREGIVQLYQSGAGPDVEGEAGDEFRIDGRGTIQRDRFSSFDPEWEWAEALAGPPQINGMRVLEFLNWIARETGRQIHYEEPGVQLAAGTAVLHGSAQDLTPMDALDVMLQTTDFNYSLLTNGVIVISRRNSSR